MATNQDTVFINTFVKGMNTDSSVQMIQNDQYINAKNIRVFPLSSSGNQFGEIKSIEGVRKILETEGLFRISIQVRYQRQKLYEITEL